MEDMTGTLVEPGDYLLDERGRVYQVRETPVTVQKEKCIYMRNIALKRGTPVPGDEGFLRARHCLKIPLDIARQSIDERKQLYAAAFQDYQADELSSEFAARRAAINAVRTRRGVNTEKGVLIDG